jgi:hypothetical protein
MFAHADETAVALVAVAEKYPGITGFNVDLEASGGTLDDGVAHAAFLRAVTAKLNAHPSGSLRFSSDVACGNAGDIAGRPLASNCSLLGRSGVNRIMNMATYNAGGLEEWMCVFLSHATLRVFSCLARSCATLTVPVRVLLATTRLCASSFQ